MTLPLKNRSSNGWLRSWEISDGYYPNGLLVRNKPGKKIFASWEDAAKYASATVPTTGQQFKQGEPVMKYYYEIKFNDGKVIRRNNLTKTLAESMFRAMEFEMLLFEVKAITWGVMK